MIDAVAAICRPFVYKVLPDLLGLPEPGRENMEAFGHMVWATMGPMNELFHEAMVGTSRCSRGWRSAATARTSIRTVSAWRCSSRRIAARSRRRRPSCWSQILLSAAADTTVMTLGTAIRAFCEFPDQYQSVAAGPVADANRVRREPALGFALAHGRTHRDARRRDRRTTSFQLARAAACCSRRPIATRANGPTPIGSTSAATCAARWAGATACTCAWAGRSRCSKPTRCSGRCCRGFSASRRRAIRSRG